ncbi:uncharacterized protein LOC135833346 [Planococcus citri]|uniref:uncharacterized protein LOC135833346 n=1 Tax=Planococcus citri TaxID=170843 RepID=UPI0031F90EC4
MVNWMNKGLFNRSPKKNRTSKPKEEKDNDLKSNEEKMNELLSSTRKLKQLVSELNSDFTSFRCNHRNAEEEVRKLRKEINTNSSIEKEFTKNKKREIDATIVCLENYLTMERVNFEFAWIHKNLFSAELLQLENKILEIRKTASKT